jgi:hypothetical protein
MTFWLGTGVPPRISAPITPESICAVFALIEPLALPRARAIGHWFWPYSGF